MPIQSYNMISFKLQKGPIRKSLLKSPELSYNPNNQLPALPNWAVPIFIPVHFHPRCTGNSSPTRDVGQLLPQQSINMLHDPL